MAVNKEDHNLTKLLKKAGDGDSSASNQLLGLVYDELRVLAHVQLKNARNQQTMHTTALVHEAYLKLFDQSQLQIKNRVHFFALSARIMRQILVDFYRKKSAAKRGGKNKDLTLKDEMVIGKTPGEELIDLDRALVKLFKLNDRLCTVVECKFFAAMNDDEIAMYLGVSDRTVRNDWQKARMWLSRELNEER